MADFYIVPPRLTVGSFDRADAVTSLNSLKGDITITADPSTGLRVSISSGQFAFSITPDFYIKKSGDTVPGNIRFIPSGSNYGLAVAAGVANPGTGTTGAIFLNTADGKLKFHDGFAWQDITAVAGIALTTADLRYLKLDGTNTPSANISMGSQFLRFANLATQALAGSAGQVFYNTDTNKLNVYNGSAWTAVGSGITSITIGIGLTTATNPIVNSGTISLDQAYDFTWTGNNTFNNVVNFAAAGQTFAASKLFIAGQSAGDLIYYSGSSWIRLGIGSSSQVLSVNTAGTSITWAASTGGGGAGTVYNGTQYSIPFYPSTGSAVTGSVNFQNTGTGISIAYTTASNNISSGALTVLGGVGIGGSLYTSSAYPNFISGVILNNGVITSGAWAGSTITGLYGGTGYTTYSKGDLLVGAGSTFIKLAVGSDNFVLTASSFSAIGLSWLPTAATGITSLNGLSSSVQFFSIGYSGTAPSFSSSGSTHTLNIPIAGTGVTGLITGIAQTIAGQKTFTSAIIGDLTGTATTAGFATTANYSLQSGYAITAGLATTSTYSYQSGYAITAGLATTATYAYQSGYAITSGFATTSANINVVNAVTNSAHPLHFSPVATGSGVAVSSNTAFSFNPSTLILSTSGLAVTASTVSTSSSTGALVVTGGVGIGGSVYTATDLNVGNSTTGRLYFSQATLGSAGTTVIPSMAFIGATNSPITLSVLADNSLSFDGSSGQLFSINNNLSTGYIFAVNDISGLPLLRANADGTVTMGEFAGNIGIGLSNPSYKLHVAGDTNLSSGYVYRINGTSVLSASSLGTGVTNSSLTALGTITTGTWAGSLITGLYGGTGYSAYTKGDILVGAGSTFIKVGSGSTNYILSSSSIYPAGVGWTWVSAVGVGTNPPYDTHDSDLWWNSDDGSLNFYYNDGDTSQWVEIAGGSGIDLSQPVHITSTVGSTSVSTGALIVDGGVGIQGELHAASLVINGTYDVVGTSITLATTAANQVIFTLDSAVYRSVKFMVQISRGSDFQVQEILLLHDATDTYLTQYAQLLSGNNLVLATYDADLNSGDIRLLVTPTYTNTTFKIYGTAVRD